MKRGALIVALMLGAGFMGCEGDVGTSELGWVTSDMWAAEDVTEDDAEDTIDGVAEDDQNTQEGGGR